MAGKKFRPFWYKFYRQQRGNAKLRGIEFLLTSEEWWEIWRGSGQFEKRGQLAHQYCMARFKDLGPYAVGNVEIITNRQNNIAGSTGRLHTKETIEKMRKVHKGKQYCPYLLGQPHQMRVVYDLLEMGLSPAKIAKGLRVSKSTIYRAIERDNRPEENEE